MANSTGSRKSSGSSGTAKKSSGTAKKSQTAARSSSSPATRPPPCMSLPSAYRPLVSSPKLPPSSRAVRENSRCAMAPKIMGSMTREEMENRLKEALNQQTGVNKDELADYISSMTDEEFNDMFTQLIAEQFKQQYAGQVEEQLGAMSAQQLAAALEMAMPEYTSEQCAQYYEQVLAFSESSYEDNLLALGYVDLDDPASINIYASSFENKEIIEQAIADYNATVSR